MTLSSYELQRTRARPLQKEIVIRPHPGQQAILDARQPVVAAIAGTGGGKTVAGMVWLLLKMAEHPNEQWLVVEPTWPMVDRILLGSSAGRVGLLELVRQIDPKAIYHQGKRAIFSATGVLYLASATHPESMEGAHVAGAWLDEAGQMGRLAFETAQRRASYKNGQLLITTTPYNRGWLFTDVYQRWQQGDPDFFVSHFASTANPNYPKDVMDRNRRTMDPARFRMMHEGAFERPQGMIYTQWSDELLVDPFPIRKEWWQGAAIDFGFNHPTAAVWCARDNDGVYYLYQEYRKAGDLLANHFAAISRLSPNGRRPDVWYGDPSAKQQIVELRRLGLPVLPADNDVLGGIDTVATLMATGRLKVFKTCRNWRDEVEGYVWDTKKDLPTDRPIEVNDDLMDATRYLLHSQEKKMGVRLYT